MGDDRALDDPAAAIKKLRADLDDATATLLARAQRRPIGTVEVCVVPTPPAGTVLLQGQVLSRTTYAGLWAWAQDRGGVGAGVGRFGTGDGSTTFTVPDLRGRVLIGAGTLGADTYTVGDVGGAATRVMSWAQMPEHQHELIDGTGTAFGTGDHGGHNTGASGYAAGAAGNVASSWFSQGFHSHSVQVAVFSLNSGSGAPFDVRQPWAAGNYAIWT